MVVRDTTIHDVPPQQAHPMEAPDVPSSPPKRRACSCPGHPNPQNSKRHQSLGFYTAKRTGQPWARRGHPRPPSREHQDKSKTRLFCHHGPAHPAGSAHPLDLDG